MGVVARRKARAGSRQRKRERPWASQMYHYWTPEINLLASKIRFNSSRKGFRVASKIVHEKMLLAVGEICEAQEELRNGRGLNEIYYNKGSDKPEGFPVEIADAIIRLLDLGVGLDIDIARVIAMKCAYNETRPRKHGRKF